jgi:hypothetical protein
MSLTVQPAAHANAAATTTPSLPAVLANWLAGVSFLHLIGIIAVVVLLALGTVTVAVGFPILTGLVGLAIPTGGTS